MTRVVTVPHSLRVPANYVSEHLVRPPEIEEAPALQIWHSEEDIVIASSAEEAAQIYSKFVGCNCGACEDLERYGEKPDHWELWSPDKPFGMTEEFDLESHADILNGSPFIIERTLHYEKVYDDDGNETDTMCLSTVNILALPSWWIQRCGRGYLASKYE